VNASSFEIDQRGITQRGTERGVDKIPVCELFFSYCHVMTTFVDIFGFDVTTLISIHGF
jgi:hypothetical protein